MIRPFSLIFLAVLALGWQVARAEAISLRQAIEAALNQNASLAVSQARIGQAEAALRQAEAARWPSLGLALSASRTNDPLSAFGAKLGQRSVTAADFQPAAINHPGDVDNFNTRLEVQVPLYTGGLLSSQIDQAQAHSQAARLGDASARQQVIQQVMLAYQGVHTARAYIKVAEQAKLAAEEALRVTERLHAQGIAIKSDLLSARVNLEEAKLKLAEGQRLESGALDRLKMLIGRPLGETIEVGAEVMPAMLAGEAAVLREQARAEHPDLNALRQQREAARARIEAARSGHRPQLSLMGRQDWNDKSLGLDASSYTVAGVLSWRLFDAGVTGAAVDQAQAAELEAAARLRQAEEAIELQLMEARRMALEADARITAREAAVAQAEEAQRLMKKRYENGIINLVELLAGQAQLDRARADLVAARYDLVAARAELRRAAGVLSLEP
ncbi:MAG: TolC family protein [Hydrogenophilaceae bacterium]|nr:TolC family protein [Hydrogenophilaceae bacterium]